MIKGTIRRQVIERNLEFMSQELEATVLDSELEAAPLVRDVRTNVIHYRNLPELKGYHFDNIEDLAVEVAEYELRRHPVEEFDVAVSGGLDGDIDVSSAPSVKASF